jgi:hypothetical protein
MMKKKQRAWLSLIFLTDTFGLIYSGIKMEHNRPDFSVQHHIFAILFFVILIVHLINNKHTLVSYIKALFNIQAKNNII